MDAAKKPRKVVKIKAPKLAKLADSSSDDEDQQKSKKNALDDRPVIAKKTINRPVTARVNAPTHASSCVTAPYPDIANSSVTGEYPSSAIDNQYAQYTNTPAIDNTSNNPDYTFVPSIDEQVLKKLGGSKDKHIISGVQMREITQLSQTTLSQAELNQRLEMRMREDAKAKFIKDNDKPTYTQQKRGNIQFLAHYAAENELELQELYARNKRTKLEVGKKYGFK